MAYTTPTLVMKAFPDAQPQQTAVPPELIVSAIASATAEIDGYLGGVYELPIAAAVPLLTHIANEIAIYYIFTARPFIAPPRPVETAWSTRYLNAVNMLKAIQAGDMALVTDGGTVVLEPSESFGGAWSSTMNYAPTFHEGDDRTFRVDPNKVEAEYARRGGAGMH